MTGAMVGTCQACATSPECGSGKCLACAPEADFASEACFCAQPSGGGSMVCIARQETLGAFSNRQICPKGTICSDANPGTFDRFPRCGAAEPRFTPRAVERAPTSNRRKRSVG